MRIFFDMYLRAIWLADRSVTSSGALDITDDRYYREIRKSWETVSREYVFYASCKRRKFVLIQYNHKLVTKHGHAEVVYNETSFAQWLVAFLCLTWKHALRDKLECVDNYKCDKEHNYASLPMLAWDLFISEGFRGFKPTVGWACLLPKMSVASRSENNCT